MSNSKSRKKAPKRVLALPDLEHAKTAVLNSLTSASGQRIYDHAIREFVTWYCSEPRLAFNRTVVLRYRIYLEHRGYALDLLILRTLQTDSLHGWAISERIQQISQDVLQINQGSLYPALHRLEHRGWIEAEWAVSELGRRAKYYRLTPSGRRQLAVEADEWERMVAAIGRVMKLA